MKVGVNDYGFYYRVTTEKKKEEEEEEELLLLLGVVIIDCLIKFTHFLIVKITYTTFQ
jgi:hypothetical protein